MAKTIESFNRSLIYLRGFADGADMLHTQKALVFFDDFHAGQKRNDGLPYASHPLFCAGFAVSLGIVLDDFIAALLFHDVIEDTKTRIKDLTVLGFSPLTLDVVDLMTKDDNQTVEEYITQMYQNPWALLGKIIDRIHNMSTMVGVFKPERARKFIEETEDFIYPMFDELKKCPEVVNRQTVYALKFTLEALVDAANAFYPKPESDPMDHATRME